MRGSIPHRLTAWLALVAVILMGIVRSHGPVLCFEPDGTVALESAGVSRACVGCDEPGTEHQSSARMVSLASECCACLDIPVDASGDEARVPPSVVERHIAPPLALAAEYSASPLAPVVARFSARSGGPPGPPGALAHIRTVVLRV